MISDAAYEFPIMRKYGEVKSENVASLLRDSHWNMFKIRWLLFQSILKITELPTIAAAASLP